MSFEITQLSKAARKAIASRGHNLQSAMWDTYGRGARVQLRDGTVLLVHPAEHDYFDPPECRYRVVVVE